MYTIVRYCEKIEKQFKGQLQKRSGLQFAMTLDKQKPVCVEGVFRVLVLHWFSNMCSQSKLEYRLVGICMCYTALHRDTIGTRPVAGNWVLEDVYLTDGIHSWDLTLHVCITLVGRHRQHVLPMGVRIRTGYPGLWYITQGHQRNMAGMWLECTGIEMELGKG